MCVAILRPPGKVIRESHLLNCWNANKHGAGFAYINAEGEVVVEKGFMEYKNLLSAWLTRTKEFDGSPFLLHFRIRTSGATDKDNTHPFKVRDGAMIHNGVLFYPDPAKHKDKSDTRVLAERMHNNFGDSDTVIAAKESIGKDIGAYNKLVFLWKDGKTCIVNEEQGNWKEGVWFSNNSWK